MGWIRSLYYPPQSQAATTAIEPADSANEVEDRKHVGIVLADVKPEFDAKKAARLARQSHGLAKIASPELLALSRASRAPVDPRDPPFIHPDEVAKHDNAEDGICELLKDVASADEPGIVVEDRVYDCTSFMNIHPGGPSMFEQFAGSQCTWQVSDMSRWVVCQMDRA